jgi:activator of HSP90 ATPase
MRHRIILSVAAILLLTMTTHTARAEAGASARIHQEVILKASPERVYAALTDAAQFSKVTSGAPTENQLQPGGAFSSFGGTIVGRNIELVPNQRIVQAWRVKTWPEGVFSIVRFELVAQGSGTRLLLDHSGYPEGSGAHLASGWQARYWEPLKKYLEQEQLSR